MELPKKINPAAAERIIRKETPSADTASICISLKLPKSLLEATDHAAKQMAITRSGFIKAALSHVLEDGVNFSFSCNQRS